jgi:hypothetical protein
MANDNQPAWNMIQQGVFLTPVYEYSTGPGKSAAIECLASCLVSGRYQVQILSETPAVMNVIIFLLSPFRQKQVGAPQMVPLQLPSTPLPIQ